MTELLQKVLEWIFARYLKSRFPGLEPLFKNLPRVFDLAHQVVLAAEATGGTGEAKKASATNSLLSLLKENKIDIPGQYDKEICAAIVEAMVTVLNRFF